MTAEEIAELIQIAANLYQVIDNAAHASNNAEVQAAWLEAQTMFKTGLQGLQDDNNQAKS